MCDFIASQWMRNYIIKINEGFGSRLYFVGLQGSYGRGEANETSDIDIVVILDDVSTDDLLSYQNMIEDMPMREKICGFISGKKELYAWDRADLFQFFYDTKPIQGSIADIERLIKKDDVRRAIHTGACNIYHGCAHNLVHERSLDILKALYKSAFFVMQAAHYFKTEKYVEKQDDLIQIVDETEQYIISICMKMKKKVESSKDDFKLYSETLLGWSSDLIETYKQCV